MNEFELIERYFGMYSSARMGVHSGDSRGVGRVGGAALRADVILGVGDDAALLRMPPGTDLVAAVDTIVEGRHFPAGSDAHSIGHRALAVNLSDIAAMGATPAWATLALTVPSVDAQWLSRFAEGFGELAKAHDVALVGGDTTAGPLTISVQILGYVANGSALRRDGGAPGDVLAVTGTLGDAGAGLLLATGRLALSDAAATAELVRRFEYATPRVSFGECARGLAHAAMDLSDGLAGDLPKLAAASGLAAHVDLERLPLSAALLRAAEESLVDGALGGARAVAVTARAQAWATSAGDDYELLLAVPAARYVELAAQARQLNLCLTSIGHLSPGSGVFWSHNGVQVADPAPGYDHFR